MVEPEFRSPLLIKLGRYGGKHMLAILGFQRQRQVITREIWRGRSASLRALGSVRIPSTVESRTIEKDI